MKTIVIKRGGSQFPFSTLSIAEGILRASEGLFDELLGSSVDLTKKKVSAYFLAYTAIGFLLKVTLDRRQVLTWVNSVFIGKLCVERPNNKSPPTNSSNYYLYT